MQIGTIYVLLFSNTCTKAKNGVAHRIARAAGQFKNTCVINAKSFELTHCVNTNSRPDMF